MGIVGFLVWNHFSGVKSKPPSDFVAAGLFAASFALLISGLLLMFPGVKFTTLDPSMIATPYAVQGAMLVWTGAVFLMASLIGLYEKLKQLIDRASQFNKSPRNGFKRSRMQI